MPEAVPREPDPIRVQWIEPEPPAPPRVVPPVKAPVPPKPKAVAKSSPPPPKPAEPLPLMAANEAPPSPQAPSPQPPAVEPPASIPAPAPAPVQTAIASAKPAEAPQPVSPPSFDAAYLRNPAPPYPSLSRRLGETGRVVLRVLVTTSGAAERVELRTSSGSSRLDSAALETVQRWKFIPAKRGDTPVAAWVLVPIAFTLEG